MLFQGRSSRTLQTARGLRRGPPRCEKIRAFHELRFGAFGNNRNLSKILEEFATNFGSPTSSDSKLFETPEICRQILEEFARSALSSGVRKRRIMGQMKLINRPSPSRGPPTAPKRRIDHSGNINGHSARLTGSPETTHR